MSIVVGSHIIDDEREALIDRLAQEYVDNFEQEETRFPRKSQAVMARHHGELSSWEKTLYHLLIVKKVSERHHEN